MPIINVIAGPCHGYELQRQYVRPGEILSIPLRSETPSLQEVLNQNSCMVESLPVADYLVHKIVIGDRTASFVRYFATPLNKPLVEVLDEVWVALKNV